MKILIKLMVFYTLFLSGNAVYATIWRVNNNGMGAQFKSLEEVNNSFYVNAGDTVYLEGSNKDYGYSIYIRKKLIIIGAGYQVNENPSTSSNGLSTMISSITFDKNSDGSQLIGVHVNGSGVNVYSNNVHIKRCRIDNMITPDYNISDLRITQNFFPLVGMGNSVFGSTTYEPSNIFFNHNIVQRPLVLMDKLTLSECNNNIIDISFDLRGEPAIKIRTGSFRNNILTKDLKIEINQNNTTNISHNIGGKMSPFGTSNNNLVVQDMATLFIDRQAKAIDAQYQLKPNSAAAGKGSDGGDIGPFGGTAVQNRYALSGIPPIPVIYSVSTSGVATQKGLPVTIKIRTVN